MTATFQKAINYTLNNINSAHAFLDDILIITKRSIDNHENEIMKILSRLDKENLAISLTSANSPKRKSYGSVTKLAQTG